MPAIQKLTRIQVSILYKINVSGTLHRRKMVCAISQYRFTNLPSLKQKMFQVDKGTSLKFG